MTADRTKGALDVYAILFGKLRSKFLRNQVKGFLVHGTSLDPVYGSGIGACILFQPSLQQGNDRGLSSADRTHQEQQALADVQPFRRRLKVFFHQGSDGIFQAEQFFTEKFVVSTFTGLLHPGVPDHPIDARVGVLGPVRMDYPSNLGAVRAVARYLSRLLDEDERAR